MARLLAFIVSVISLKIHTLLGVYGYNLDSVLLRDKRGVGFNFFTNPTTNWTLPIPFRISGLFSDEQTAHIQWTVAMFENLTCLTFNELANDDEAAGEQFIKFTVSLTECSSVVGRQDPDETDPPQAILMDAGCFDQELEAGHMLARALGMEYEHRRPDRDQAVTVQWDNVFLGCEDEFSLLNDSDYTVHDTLYDHGSLMHRPHQGCGWDNNKDTLTPVDSGHLRAMGQRVELTFSDVRWINRAYCSEECEEELPCENNGYTDPNDCSVCRCMPEYTGALCTDISPGTEGCSPVSGEYILSADMDEVCLSSPEFNDGEGSFTPGDECYWKIKAAAGCQLMFWSASGDGYLRADGDDWCIDWVEVKHQDGHVVTGHRACDEDFKNTSLRYAKANTATVLFRSHYTENPSDGNHIGFKFCFTVVDTVCFGEETTTTTTTTTTTSTTTSPKTTTDGPSSTVDKQSSTKEAEKTTIVTSTKTLPPETTLAKSTLLTSLATILATTTHSPDITTTAVTEQTSSTAAPVKEKDGGEGFPLYAVLIPSVLAFVCLLAVASLCIVLCMRQRKDRVAPQTNAKGFPPKGKMMPFISD